MLNGLRRHGEILPFRVILPTLLLSLRTPTESTLHKITAELMQEFSMRPVTSIIVTMKNNTRAVTQSMPRIALHNTDVEAAEMVEKLQEHAFESQKNLLAMVKQAGLRQSRSDYTVLWTSNELYVKNANWSLVEAFSRMDEVQQIMEDTALEASKAENASDDSHTERHRPPDPHIPWNIDRIYAPEVWSLFVYGSNVRYAVVDTGVLWRHEALRESFVGHGHYKSGWYDPAYRRINATDNIGRGTEMASIISGGCSANCKGVVRNVGVAPYARWMACRACENDRKCKLSFIKMCIAWMICPRKYGLPDEQKRCINRPKVVAMDINSNPRYHALVPNLSLLADTFSVIVVVSAGDRGPNCETITNPGNYDFVITVGATHPGDDMLKSSGTGPSSPPDPRLIKPDFVAPGGTIWVAKLQSLNVDAFWQATSVQYGAAHVVGLIALLLTVSPNLTKDEVHFKMTAMTGAIRDCKVACDPLDQDDVPNDRCGHGIVNAYVSLFAPKNLKEHPPIINRRRRSIGKKCLPPASA